MIHAYDKLYLEKAKANLGRMLDYAVNELGIDLEEFYNHFLKSGLAAAFETGDCSVIVGRSAVENIWAIYEHNSLVVKKESSVSLGRSKEYWTGWAVAHYQWYTGMRFEEIEKVVPIKEIYDLYSPYHEMDIRQFVDYMNEIYTKRNPMSKLKAKRLLAGLSQSQLAEISGVPLRTIQQYEQRQKNINKAQAEYLLMLARALCCRMEELLEKVNIVA